MNDYVGFIFVIAMILVLATLGAKLFVDLDTEQKYREYMADDSHFEQELESDEPLQAFSDTTEISGSVNGSTFLTIGSVSGSVSTQYVYRYMLGSDEEGYKTYSAEGDNSIVKPVKVGESPHVECYKDIAKEDNEKLKVKKGEERPFEYATKHYVFYIPKENITALGSYNVDLQ